jgi:hypothetical protein
MYPHSPAFHIIRVKSRFLAPFAVIRYIHFIGLEDGNDETVLMTRLEENADPA